MTKEQMTAAAVPRLWPRLPRTEMMAKTIPIPASGSGGKPIQPAEKRQQAHQEEYAGKKSEEQPNQPCDHGFLTI